MTREWNPSFYGHQQDGSTGTQLAGPRLSSSDSQLAGQTALSAIVSQSTGSPFNTLSLGAMSTDQIHALGAQLLQEAVQTVVSALDQNASLLERALGEVPSVPLSAESFAELQPIANQFAMVKQDAPKKPTPPGVEERKRKLRDDIAKKKFAWWVKLLTTILEGVAGVVGGLRLGKQAKGTLEKLAKSKSIQKALEDLGKALRKERDLKKAAKALGDLFFHMVDEMGGWQKLLEGLFDFSWFGLLVALAKLIGKWALLLLDILKFLVDLLELFQGQELDDMEKELEQLEKEYPSPTPTGMQAPTLALPAASAPIRQTLPLVQSYTVQPVLQPIIEAPQQSIVNQITPLVQSYALRGLLSSIIGSPST